MKFAHIADIHIRNIKRHEQYKLVFDKLYSQLEQEKVDSIVIPGDLAHSKTDLSPEYVSLASSFIRRLASLASRVDIIPGNHDLNLNNRSREDAITPIVNNLKLGNVFLHKKSGLYDINDKFRLAVFSCVDETNYPKVEASDKITIALYHGILNGSKSDSFDNILVNNKMLLVSNDSLSLFENCDYGFFGDVHAAQALDSNNRFHYAGSLIQQNVGENLEKGFLIWDIKDKINFEVRKINFTVPGMFCTIIVDEDKKVKKTEIVDDCSLRVYYDPSLEYSSVVDIVSKIKENNKIHEVYYVKNKKYYSNTIATKSEISSKTYSSLLDYVKKDGTRSSEFLEKIAKIDEEISSKIDVDDNNRGFIWQIDELSWSNMFLYGEDNIIKFSQKEGIVGIFGKNGVGKSAIIDIILWIIFSNISKKAKKNSWLIHDKKDNCWAKIIISANDDFKYIIERNLTRGKKNDSSGGSVNFYKTDKNGVKQLLNGVDTNETNKNIRGTFGSFDNFIMTSLSPSGMMGSFIKNAGSERLELISYFLGINKYRMKETLAKTMSDELKVFLKKNDDRDFDKELYESKSEIAKNEMFIETIQEKISPLILKVDRLNEKLLSNSVKIVDNIEMVDVELLNNEFEAKKKEKLELEKIIDDFYKKIGMCQGALFLLKEAIQKVDNDEGIVKEYNEQKQKIEELDALLSKLNSNISLLESSVSILSKVPCENKSCILISDAFDKKDKLKELNQQIERLVSEKITLSEKFEPLNEKFIKYNAKLEKKNENENKIKTLTLSISKIQKSIIENAQKESLLQSSLNQIEAKIIEAIKNKEKMENNKLLLEENNAIEKERDEIKKSLNKLEKEKNNYVESIGAAKLTSENIEKNKAEYIAAKNDYEVYLSYINATSRNGLPFQIIVDNLDLINEEIKDVLKSNNFDFDVIFDNNSEKNELELFLIRNEIKRHLELASESERYVASFAIRIALINICSLPKPNFFIVDESFGVFDSERIHDFMGIFEYIKNRFKNVFMITHVDEAKSLADHSLIVEEKDGFSYVS